MFTEVCTCCGVTFQEDVPQEIGEELCPACFKAIVFEDDDEDESPLEFNQDIYTPEEFFVDFSEFDNLLGETA